MIVESHSIAAEPQRIAVE